MLRFNRGPVRPKAEFLLARPNIPGAHTVELMAQLRNTGRILDACRVVLGGEDIIQVDFDLFCAIPSPRLAGWRLRYQVWPRDINIRANLTTSNWHDLEAIVASRDAQIIDRDGAFIPQGEFLGMLADTDPPNSGSVRWAVISGDDGGLQLQLQGLPGSAPTLNGKPLLRK